MTSATVRREFNPRPLQSGTWIKMKGLHFVPQRQGGGRLFVSLVPVLLSRGFVYPDGRSVWGILLLQC